MAFVRLLFGAGAISWVASAGASIGVADIVGLTGARISGVGPEKSFPVILESKAISEKGNQSGNENLSMPLTRRSSVIQAVVYPGWVFLVLGLEFIFT